MKNWWIKENKWINDPSSIYNISSFQPNTMFINSYMIYLPTFPGVPIYFGWKSFYFPPPFFSGNHIFSPLFLIFLWKMPIFHLFSPLFHFFPFFIPPPGGGLIFHNIYVSLNLPLPKPSSDLSTAYLDQGYIFWM